MGGNAILARPPRVVRNATCLLGLNTWASARGAGGAAAPPLDFGSRCISESTFSKQLPAAVTTAASCNQKGLFYRPCSSKFPNFLALAREPEQKQFLWQARAKIVNFFLLFHSFYMYNALLYAVNLTL